MQKHVNLVDLAKSFPTNIFLQNLASIPKRTSPIKFAPLAEKSEKGSISNLSTKLFTGRAGGAVSRRLASLLGIAAHHCDSRRTPLLVKFAAELAASSRRYALVSFSFVGLGGKLPRFF